MRRLVLIGSSFLLALWGAFPGASAKDAVTVTVSTVVGTDGSGGPSAEEQNRSGWVNPCPVDLVRSPATLVDRGPLGKGYYQPVQCDLDVGWTTRWVCLVDCPSGTPDTIEIPQPPSWEEIYLSITRAVPTPRPQFAPPLHRDPSLAAIVGKRLYMTLSPTTFTETDGSYSDQTGLWKVRILFVPVSYNFTGQGQTSSSCTLTVAPDSAARRKQLDGAGCFIVLTKHSGPTPITITSKWRAVINTNIPNIPRVVPLETTTTYDINVKQLQAVVG
jgi:hypothetical protein